MKPQFTPGNNMAMKIPSHEYQATLAFYREVLALTEITSPEPGSTPRFAFGDKTLWLDNVATLSQAEIWLEIVTDNPQAAAEYFNKAGIQRCDDIEPLPADFKGFWITSPSNIIHLLSSQ
ncbi:hypothetical protein GCM10009092_02200 [Bowmanella denitrificans]|uniref:VOC domain-containing protein n=1 Tax=Bowmanella denitrificans TaxID=366582 RepID=A0ABN0WLI7_9ALTE